MSIAIITGRSPYTPYLPATIMARINNMKTASKNAICTSKISAQTTHRNTQYRRIRS